MVLWHTHFKCSTSNLAGQVDDVGVGIVEGKQNPIAVVHVHCADVGEALVVVVSCSGGEL